MALRLLAVCTLRKATQIATPKLVPKFQIGSVASIHTLDKVGSRDIVGHGWNGTACYADRADYPMPAVRFRESNKEIAVLREKEKQDWRKMSLEEKKALYRASFCQTFAEMKAPTGEWKFHIGSTLIATSLAILICLLMNIFVYQELPETFSEERQKAQLKRMIDLEINPVHGLASKWDYENNKWK